MITLDKLVLSPSVLEMALDCPRKFAYLYLNGGISTESKEEDTANLDWNLPMSSGELRRKQGTEIHRLIETDLPGTNSWLNTVYQKYKAYYGPQIIHSKEQRLEYMITPTLGLNGKYDRIEIIDGNPVIVDVKTIKKAGHKYYEIKDIDYQLTCYAYLTWKNLPELVGNNGIRIMIDLINIYEYKYLPKEYSPFERIHSFRTIQQLEEFEQETLRMLEEIRFKIEANRLDKRSFRSNCTAYNDICPKLSECVAGIPPDIQLPSLNERAIITVKEKKND